MHKTLRYYSRDCFFFSKSEKIALQWNQYQTKGNQNPRNGEQLSPSFASTTFFDFDVWAGVVVDDHGCGLTKSIQNSNCDQKMRRAKEDPHSVHHLQSARILISILYE